MQIRQQAMAEDSSGVGIYASQLLKAACAAQSKGLLCLLCAFYDVFPQLRQKCQHDRAKTAFLPDFPTTCRQFSQKCVHTSQVYFRTRHDNKQTEVGNKQQQARGEPLGRVPRSACCSWRRSYFSPTVLLSIYIRLCDEYIYLKLLRVYLSRKRKS